MTQVTQSILNRFLATLAQRRLNQGDQEAFFRLYQDYLRQHCTPLRRPGKILLVIGTGRNGSTSITGALRHLPNRLITHERPPLVF